MRVDGRPLLDVPRGAAGRHEISCQNGQGRSPRQRFRADTGPVAPARDRPFSPRRARRADKWGTTGCSQLRARNRWSWPLDPRARLGHAYLLVVAPSVTAAAVSYGRHKQQGDRPSMVEFVEKVGVALLGTMAILYLIVAAIAFALLSFCIVTIFR
jgi:hypothetical protein